MKDDNLREQKMIHKQGSPWRVVHRTPNYEDADLHRNELLQGWKDEGVGYMQAKVKRMFSTDSFIVKTRKDPSAAGEKKVPKDKKGKKDKSDKSDKSDKGKKGRNTQRARKQKK